MLKCNFYFTGREEFLTEAVFFWNKRKIKCLPKILGLRLKKVGFNIKMNMIIFSRYAHLETILEIICNHTSSTRVHKYVLIAK